MKLGLTGCMGCHSSSKLEACLGQGLPSTGRGKLQITYHLYEFESEVYLGRELSPVSREIRLDRLREMIFVVDVEGVSRTGARKRRTRKVSNGVPAVSDFVRNILRYGSMLFVKEIKLDGLRKILLVVDAEGVSQTRARTHRHVISEDQSLVTPDLGKTFFEYA
jgi:hypothetical protein